LSDACHAGVLAGIPLGKWYPELADSFLVTVTEKRTKLEIERLADQLSKPGVQEGRLAVRPSGEVTQQRRVRST
jgi:glycine dehydrogenase subunit 1